MIAARAANWETAVEQIERASGSDTPRRFDWQCRTKDGQLFWAEISLRRASIGGEKVVLSIVRDLTERRTIEEQLRQAQKMEAIGQLTGGIAHDFNNLLGVIIGNLDLVRETMTGNEDLADLTSDALTAALGGAELTRRLLAFARRQPLQPEVTDLRDLIENAAKLLRRVLGEKVDVTLAFEDDCSPVNIDKVQLEAALTNLATNARDAMPKGGRLHIATGRRRIDAGDADGAQEIPAGDYMVIEVTDSGVGMPPEVASRIFEPFYTTKGRDRGTGLGLSMVFGFLKQSGGHVSVYSEVGIGTTFRLYLPSAAGAPAAKAAASAPLRSSSHGETVLVVEDNAALRSIAARQLRELGYAVLEAKDSAEAIGICERGGVHALFSDVVLPGDMDGVELAHEATRRWPELKVLLTSGFPETKFADRLDKPEFRLLAKPYRKSELASLLREIMDAPVRQASFH